MLARWCFLCGPRRTVILCMLERPLCFCPSPLPTPTHRHSPPLISHLVSVAVKQHVYLLTIVFTLVTCLLRNKPRCCTHGICCGLFCSLLDCILCCLSHCYHSMPHHTKNRLILKCLLVHLDNSNGNVAHYRKWQSIKDDNHCPVFSRTLLSSICFVNGRSHATHQVSMLESANVKCWQVCLKITGGNKNSISCKSTDFKRLCMHPKYVLK